MRLLPTPVVSFTDIRVGDPAAPDVEMEHFRAEIDLAPLLEGQVRIIQMTIDRPQFHLDIARLAANPDDIAGGWRLDPDRISLERLQVNGGSALLSDSATGRNWQADGIDAVVEADSLLGPGRLTADMQVNGKPVSLSVGLGRLTEGAIAAKISARSPDFPVALLLDGTYHFPGAKAAKYDGIATLEGLLPKDPATPRSPWADLRSSGKFELTPAELKIDKMQVSYGGTGRPLVLEASGKMELGADPRFVASLAARQIDLDKTLGGGATNPLSIAAALSALTEALPLVKLPPLPGKLHLGAQGVVLGGSVIEGVSIDLATANFAWEVENLSATLPGETQVDFSGTLGLDPPAFRGHGKIASRRPAPFAAWWRGEIGSAAKIGRFSLEADLDFGAEAERFSNLVATTATGSMRGALDVHRFSQTGKLIVNVDLSAERADLVETRALAQLLAGKAVAEGNVEQMTLSLSADVLSAGGVEAKSVVVDGGLEGGEFNLRKLSVADLAGASIDALGSIRDPLGKPSGRIEATVKASNFQGAADFLASLAPESRIARHLKAVAPILSPVNAEVSAESGAADERLALSVTGSFAGTHVTLEADGQGAPDNPASLTGKVALHADGEDSVQVLRQIGLHPLPMHSAPLTVDATFEGRLAAAGKLGAKGTIAGVDFDYAAETTLNDGALSLSGPLKAESADIDPLLLLAGAAVPGVGEGHAASMAGRLDYSGASVSLAIDQGSFAGQSVGGVLQATLAPDIALSGALDLKAASLPFLASLAVGSEPGVGLEGWSDTPFASPLPPNVGIDLSINAATLDLGMPLPATDARIDFALSAGTLHLDLVDSHFAGGMLKGAIAATVHDGDAEMTLRGALAGADLQGLVWEEGGLPAVSGKLDLSIEAAGRGRSLSGIVATLGGSGSFSVDDGRLNALNAGALTAVMASAEGDKEPDETEARETFAQLFGSGALAFGRAAGAFSISDGVVAVPTVSLADATTTILAGGKLDLNALSLASDWAVRAVGEGDEASQPSVQVHFSGSIAAPQRKVDLDPLINRLRSRYLQRQIEQLEAAEAARRQADEERRSAIADRRDLELGALPAIPTAPVPDVPALPIPAPTTPAPAPTVLSPTLLDPVPAPDSPNAVETGPDLPPIEPPVQPSSPPPAPRAQSTPRAAAPVIPPIPPPAAPTPAETFGSQFRTLPNGTIVKIR